jgi:hypothetical protein
VGVCDVDCANPFVGVDGFEGTGTKVVDAALVCGGDPGAAVACEPGCDEDFEKGAVAVGGCAAGAETIGAGTGDIDAGAERVAVAWTAFAVDDGTIAADAGVGRELAEGVAATLEVAGRGDCVAGCDGGVAAFETCAVAEGVPVAGAGTGKAGADTDAGGLKVPAGFIGFAAAMGDIAEEAAAVDGADPTLSVSTRVDVCAFAGASAPDNLGEFAGGGTVATTALLLDASAGIVDAALLTD